MRWRTLLFLNVVYFAAVLAGAVYAYVGAPDRATMGSVGLASISELTAEQVTEALYIALLSFLSRLLVSSLLLITLVSAVLPFGGIAVGLVRAFVAGMAVAGAGVQLSALAVSLPLAVLEGEGYIIAMAGVWSWWRLVSRSREGRWSAWVHGLREQPRVYLGVACWLAAAAIYEAAVLVLLRRS